MTAIAPANARTSPLRVAIVTTFYPPCNFGGDGHYVRRWVHALARRGCEVEVIYDADAWRVGMGIVGPKRAPPPLPEPDGVTVHRLESGWALGSTILTQQTGHPVIQRAKIEAILSKGFDVIHYHNISLVGGPGVLKLGSGIKLYTVHEHWLVCPNHVLWRHNRELCDARECARCLVAFKRPPQAWRATSLLDDSLSHVDAIIALSKSVAENHAAFGLKQPMVSMASFLTDRKDAATPKAKLRSTRPYFLFVGRLEVIKGLQEVIPLFNADFPADLVIAGSGKYESTLRALAKGRENVRFLGNIPSSELGSLYADAVALLAPSLCYEVFPLVILEAFREGTPIIARKLGPYPQIVDESGGGVLFQTAEELGAAMTALLNDSEKRDRLGQAGLSALAERWSETRAVDDWLDLVHDIAVKNARVETIGRVMTSRGLSNVGKVQGKIAKGAR